MTNTTTPLALDFVEVDAGALVVTHRPKVKLLPAMRAAGVTHVVTLLSRREGALAMGAAVSRAGLEWIWVELPHGRQPAPAQQHRIVTALATGATLLGEGARMVVHCSAGIHRTGMFTYALLRTLGLEADQARRMLVRLRAATAEGVGEQRLEWAERLAAAARRQRQLDAASSR
jgi:protein-tyrosine phosphatase